MAICLENFEDIIRVVTQPRTPLEGVLSGYEFTSLIKLQTNFVIWQRLKQKLNSLHQKKYALLKEEQALSLDSNERLTTFITAQIKNVCVHNLEVGVLLRGYVCSDNLSELHLDAIFKYGDDNQLPKELFSCTNTKLLSLKFNSLEEIPADIGRMEKLESLILTNNKLQNRSLPFTLTFCQRLTDLKLDNNLLDALPGFLLRMEGLERVHRHGNHNYFKSTFMWYHTDVNQRVIALPRQTLPHNAFSSVNQSTTQQLNYNLSPTQPLSLQLIATKQLIANKTNFFKDHRVSPGMKQHLSQHYHLFNLCDACHTACLYYQPGYKVITFKNPYLGNTCIPFQHWTCSYQCALSIEIPARQEQVCAAKLLDKQYEDYTHSCQSTFVQPSNNKHKQRVLRDAARMSSRSLLCWCSQKRLSTISLSSSSSSSVVLRSHP